MTEDAEEQAQAPEAGVGERLLAAREAAGLSRTDVAARTKIPERHLTSIEEGNFAALAGRTYAIGFSRTYARTVGLDEDEIAAAVREELAAGDGDDDVYVGSGYEPGDPSRVPGRGMAWLAALGAFVVILAGFFLWRSFSSPAGDLPSLLPDAPEVTAPAEGEVKPAVADAPPVSDAVVLTATEAGVWVKVYDASRKQLFQKEMALGESYTVPADAQGPLLWTGRPDALTLTIGGKPVPPLADRQVTVKDVPVSAAALLARGTEETGAPAAAATSAPASGAPAASAPRRTAPSARRPSPLPYTPPPSTAVPQIDAAPAATAPVHVSVPPPVAPGPASTDSD